MHGYLRYWLTINGKKYNTSIMYMFDICECGDWQIEIVYMSASCV